MNNFMDYSYLIIPVIVIVVSQALKLATDGIKGNFDVRNLLSFYGGMPSSHTAFTASVTMLLGLRLGFDAPIFALSLVFTLLVARDAIGLRRVIGWQSEAINALQLRLGLSTLNPLRERMGHSLAEVLAGALLGVALAWLLTIL